MYGGKSSGGGKSTLLKDRHNNMSLEPHIPIEVIFENEDLIAINKPHGLLVHRSRIASDARTFALQLVRNLTGSHVYPAHRLDRKTSGVLLFSKSKKANVECQRLFRERLITKIYHAIVRGYTDEDGHIDYPLTDQNKSRSARTNYKSLRRFEIDIPSYKFQSSRYSLLEILPETGRYHQIRKHMAHIFHPIIGDRPHGCNKQNKLWKERFEMNRMMLHAVSLKFEYPKGNELYITAPYSQEFQDSLKILGHHGLE